MPGSGRGSSGRATGAGGGTAERANFVVMPRRGAAGGTTALPQFLRAIESDPSIDLVRALGGTADPVGVLVQMTPDRAEQLHREFGTSLIISRDEPLEPIPEPGPRPPG